MSSSTGRAPKNGEEAARRGPFRILVVEDDYELQEFIALALKELGHELHFVDNGKEAVRKAAALQPNAFLLDLNLPHMNGIEVYRSLEAMGLLRNAPCIFMTAMQDAGGILSSATRALGALQFLQKPFTSADLIDTLNLALSKPSASLPGGEIKKGSLRLDPKFRRVWIKDKFIGYLSPKRFQILLALATADGPVDRETLLRKVWGGEDELNTVDKTIQRLREDLGPEGLRRIQTTPGGYELVS